MSLKVLFVTNGYPSFRRPVNCVFTREQIQYLTERYPSVQHDIVVIDTGKNGFVDYIRKTIEVVLKYRSYDIVHVFHLLTAFCVFWLPGRPKVISLLSDGVNEVLPPYRYLISGGMYHRLLGKFDARIFKNRIPPHFSSDPLSFHLPNGVDLSFFSPIDRRIAKARLGLRDDKRYVLFVSSQNRWRKEKRYDRYLNVLKLLREKHHLCDVEQLVLDNVQRNDVPMYYAASSLHLLTSDYEGSPNSVKEALAMNISVVATDVGDLSAIIPQFRNSYVSRSGDDEDLADKCAAVLNANTVNDYRETVRKLHLDVQSKTDELYRIYEKVCNGSKRQ